MASDNGSASPGVIGQLASAWLAGAVAWQSAAVAHAVTMATLPGVALRAAVPALNGGQRRDRQVQPAPRAAGRAGR